tara:strand:+ start:96887 stop:97090 length:204 start_codon:yes stop_codon:yes gene_type:complete
LFAAFCLYGCQLIAAYNLKAYKDVDVTDLNTFNYKFKVFIFKVLRWILVANWFIVCNWNRACNKNRL